MLIYNIKHGKKKEFSIYKCLLNLFALSSNGDGLVVKKTDQFYVSPFYSLLPNLLLCWNIFFCKQYAC